MFIFSATSADTRVYFELDARNNLHLEFHVGDSIYDPTIEKFLVMAKYDANSNYFIAETKGDFQTDILKVAVLVETLNAFGETASDRKFAYRQSLYFGSKSFEPFETYSGKQFFVEINI